ncbi:MAG: cupin domain-containing protein [Chloroflexota bacterium]
MSQAIFGNIEQLLKNMAADDPPKNVISGSPTTLYGELLSQDGLDVGVWRCTVGTWEITNYSINEVMLMLSGKMRLTDSSGHSKDLAKGDLFFIPKGWRGTWEVVEEMEKVYVIMS